MGGLLLSWILRPSAQNNRSGMSLPKGRKSTNGTPTHAMSPNFGGDDVSLPVTEGVCSPEKTPGIADDVETTSRALRRHSSGAGSSPLPTEADRRRQDAVARALGVEASTPQSLPMTSPMQKAAPNNSACVPPKDFDFTSEVEAEETKGKRPMAQIQAHIDAENVSEAAKTTSKTSKAAKENKAKRTAGKENATRKTKRNKSTAQPEAVMTPA